MLLVDQILQRESVVAACSRADVRAAIAVLVSPLFAIAELDEAGTLIVSRPPA
ncbi:MAG: hypothetical protein ACREQ5_24715 [Candidatus Dormibacteria bacterium]